MCNRRCCAILVLLIAAAIPSIILAAQHHTRLSGLSPLWHVGLKWEFTHDQIPDLSGKVALVTGANVGIGQSTAKYLCKNGAETIMVCRSAARCDAAKAAIEAELGKEMKGSLRTELMDLSDLDSVSALASKLASTLTRLDSVVLNAGVMATPFGLTKQGFEMQVGTNHFGHTLFIKKLLPFLQAQSPNPVHVAVVSSGAHWQHSPDGIPTSLERLNDESKYNPLHAYGDSKLANIFMTRALVEELGPQSNVFVNVIHPGGVASDLARHIIEAAEARVGASIANLLHKALLQIMWATDDGAVTQLYCAVSPEIPRQNIRGVYFVPQAREWVTHPVADDKEMQARFWEFTNEQLKKWL